MKHKAYEIGILLSIPDVILKEFLREEDPLSEILAHWLRPDAPITWPTIVKVLESELVDEATCAQKVKSIFCDSKAEKSKPCICT